MFDHCCCRNFFAFKSQTISQEQVLNTLSEISSQSVNVIDKEIQKMLQF